MPDVTDGEQLKLFDTGEPVRRKPTPEELYPVAEAKARIVIWAFHRGRPPLGGDWDDLRQSVIVGTLERLKKFMHGGPKTLDNYTYVAACFALRDIQRKNMRWSKQQERTFENTLLDTLGSPGEDAEEVA